MAHNFCSAAVLYEFWGGHFCLMPHYVGRSTVTAAGHAESMVCDGDKLKPRLGEN